jgi:hypothetical protein
MYFSFKDDDLHPHAFYLAGIFLRTTSEEVSVTPLSSITEQQWWDMMRRAWYSAFLTIDNTRCVEFLPVLVEGTKKYIHIAPKTTLWQIEVMHLIRDLDDLITRVECRDVLEHRERVVVALKELSGVAIDTLANSVHT